MNIIEAPSPNFNARTKPVSLIVLHYTGMESGQAALDRMCDPAAKVSAHYMVEEDGRIFRLVDESRRAWHAGVSEWAGETDINSISIGIEIVNGGHDYALPDYLVTQINAVISLTKEIMSRHSIPAHRVVGHSDIAPDRKQDPGEKFPWQKLAAAGCSIWPDFMPPGKGRSFLRKGTVHGVVADLQGELADIGFPWNTNRAYDEHMVKVVEAFQRRFRPELIDGIIDKQTRWRIDQVASITVGRSTLNIPRQLDDPA